MLTLIAIAVTVLIAFGMFVWLHERREAWRTDNTQLGHAPQCSRCRKPMKVRTLLPGRKVDDVAYRGEACGEEVVREVPRVWWALCSLIGTLRDNPAGSASAAHDGAPLIEILPLPAQAQFLNVIESVFSGMARAVIHNSDYATVGDAQAAITRYLEDRNRSFAVAPRRAGRSIWGQERMPAAFALTNNCKDVRYR
jgi:hypothetical protein